MTAEDMDDVSGLDLSALGLGSTAERVFRELLQCDAVTNEELTRRLAESRTSVRRAVEELVGRGLVRRATGSGRAVPVLLNRLDEALTVIRSRAVEAAGEHDRALARLQEKVNGLGTAQDPEPAYLTPLVRPERTNNPALGFGRPQRSVKMCVQDAFTCHSFAARRPGLSEIRIILCQTRHLARWLGPVAQVRMHWGPLPDFCIVDGERVGVKLLVDGQRRVGWSTDGMHAELADRLFGLLWSEAKPYT